MAMIMVVEDNEPSRDALARRLERRGYKVVLAQDGLEAVVLGRRTLPDLIVMDLMMPEMDGFDAAAALRADARTRALPIIAFSAASRPSVVERVRESGMNGLVTKSNSHSDLVHTVRAYLPSDQLWPRL